MLMINFLYGRRLEEHFRKDHLICEDPLCLAKRYVVFSNGIDLAAHGLQIHPFMQVKRVSFFLRKYVNDPILYILSP